MTPSTTSDSEPSFVLTEGITVEDLCNAALCRQRVYLAHVHWMREDSLDAYFVLNATLDEYARQLKRIVPTGTKTYSAAELNDIIVGVASQLGIAFVPTQ